MAEIPFPSNVPNLFPVGVGLTLPAPWFAASAFAFPFALEFSDCDPTPIPKKDMIFDPICFAPSSRPPEESVVRKFCITDVPVVFRFSCPSASPSTAPGQTWLNMLFTAWDGLCTSSAARRLSKNASTPSVAGSARSSKPSRPSNAPYHACAHIS